MSTTVPECLCIYVCASRPPFNEPIFVCLFVVPDEISQPIPVITLCVDVVHATPQTRLQVLGVVAEQPHDHAPAETGKDGPGIVAHGAANIVPCRHDGQAKGAVFLDRQLGQGQGDAREDVNDNLLVDARDLA